MILAMAEQTRLRATEDFKEGVKATEERRAPKSKAVSLFAFWEYAAFITPLGCGLMSR